MDHSAEAAPDGREARARELVLRLYEGKRDSHGRPMAEHVEAVVERCPDEVKLLGWLHDVAEDGLMPLQDVSREMSLSRHEHEALGLLTKEEATPYAEYIERLAQAAPPAGDLARKVKIADLRANLSRAPHPSRPDLELRYRAALRRLGA